MDLIDIGLGGVDQQQSFVNKVINLQVPWKVKLSLWFWLSTMPRRH